MTRSTAASEFAVGELEERVRARMRMSVTAPVDSTAQVDERPCLPVEPTYENRVPVVDDGVASSGSGEHGGARKGVRAWSLLCNTSYKIHSFSSISKQTQEIKPLV